MGPNTGRYSFSLSHTKRPLSRLAWNYLQMFEGDALHHHRRDTRRRYYWATYNSRGQENHDDDDTTLAAHVFISLVWCSSGIGISIIGANYLSRLVYFTFFIHKQLLPFSNYKVICEVSSCIYLCTRNKGFSLIINSLLLIFIAHSEFCCKMFTNSSTNRHPIKFTNISTTRINI